MTYRVPRNAEYGAGRKFASQNAYAFWVSKQKAAERVPTVEQYKSYDWGDGYISSKILGKTKTVTKRNYSKRWS